MQKIKKTDWVAYKIEINFLTVLEVGKSKIKVPAFSFAGGGSLAGL